MSNASVRRLWRRFVHDPWYWVRCRAWHRYNVVVCHSLPPTWCDRDHLMLFCCFQILQDFAEKEQPWELTGDVRAAYADFPEEGERRAKTWKTVRDLLDWWRDRSVDEDFDDDALDQKMLHRLVSVRQVLWT